MSEKEVKKYTMAEVKEKASTNSPWIVINDCIYDVTDFLNDVRWNSRDRLLFYGI